MNKGNPHILGINTDLYNFSGGQPDSTYQILTFDQVVPLLGMILLSHCSRTQSYRRIFATAVCAGKAQGRQTGTLLGMAERRARHSVFLKPSACHEMRLSVKRPRAAQGAAALMARTFSGIRESRKPDCSQSGSNTVFFTLAASLTDMSEGLAGHPRSY